MAVIETWLTQDLKKPVQVQHLCGNFFSHNGNANQIGVRVFDDDEPATLSGTVSGYAVLPDGTTVPCTGTLSGNAASVLLPAAAYVPGNICVTIMLTSGTTITTLAALTGSVVMARTDTQVDPGSVVTDWTTTINAAMQEVETAAENMGGIVATPYTSLTYPVPLGKYCIHDYKLYRCVSPISSSEEWTSSHWTQVRIGDELNTEKAERQTADIYLHNGLDAIFVPSEWNPSLTNSRRYNPDTGVGATSPNHCRTSIWNGYGTRSAVSLGNSSTYEYYLTFYDENGSAAGAGFNGSTGYTSGIMYIPTTAIKFGVSIRRIDRVALTSTDITAIQAALVAYTLTDSTLTQAHKAADAKATGDAITAETTARENAVSAEATARTSADTEIKSLADYISGTIVCGKKTIAHGTIDSNGVISAVSSNKKLICFAVQPKTKLYVSGSLDMFAFYTSEPIVGSTSYNGSSSAQPSISNYTVPDGVSWIAIRTPSSGDLTISPYTSAFQYIKTQETGESLNTFKANGIYIITDSSVSSAPIASNGILIVAGLGADKFMQNYITFNSPIRVFTRVCTSGSFGAWEETAGLKGTGQPLNVAGITDLNDCPINRVYIRYNTQNETAHLPYTDWMGSVFTLSYTNTFVVGTIQLAFSSTGRFHYRRTWGSNNTWNAWREFVRTIDLPGVNGLVGSYTHTFPDTREAVTTGITMEANTSYVISCYSLRTGRFNIYGSGNTSNLTRIQAWQTEVIFTNDGTERELSLYNIDNNADTVTFEVFKIGSLQKKVEEVPKKYIVSKSTSASGTIPDYRSFTECLLALKDDVSPKIIEIWEGDYDLYSEYSTAGVPVYTGTNPEQDFFNYCVWIPSNTHIIGKGIVRLNWMPLPSAHPEMTSAQCRCVSPLNVAGTATIENVEVHCKNGRYCLHNDPLGYVQYTGAIQTYKNVRFYKYANDTDPNSGEKYGFPPTTGFGIDRAMRHVYENCVFYNEASGRAFYGHSRIKSGTTTLTEVMSPDITLTNCAFETNRTEDIIKFGNQPNDNLHIRVLFANCYIPGKIIAQDESGGANYKNAFDMTFINCGTVDVDISDPTNPYTPKGYGTTIT